MGQRGFQHRKRVADKWENNLRGNVWRSLWWLAWEKQLKKPKKRTKRNRNKRKEEESSSSGSGWVLRWGAARAACGSASRQHEEPFLPAVAETWKTNPKAAVGEARSRAAAAGPPGISAEGRHEDEEGPAGGAGTQRWGEERAALGHPGCALRWFLPLASFCALGSDISAACVPRFPLQVMET